MGKTMLRGRQRSIGKMQQSKSRTYLLHLKKLLLEHKMFMDQDETESVSAGAKQGEILSSIRRCNAIATSNANMVNLMNTFFSDVNSQIVALVAKVGTEKDAKSQRYNLIKELANFPFSVTYKIIVAKMICANVNDVDIFSGLDLEQREARVTMVLNRSYYK